MLISELVAALEEILAEHGDVEVLHHDDLSDLSVERVVFSPAVKRSVFEEDSACVVLLSPQYKS